MAEDPENTDPRKLDERIAAARKKLEPKPRADEHYSRANLAWRMVIELVAGLAIGFGIGYGLDVLFGTMPLFLVLFILAGFAAGVKVMLRTAKEVTVEDEGRGNGG
ncbi:AtpZ/AtpI family protein [Roseitranquillus sediminis]|uniref:AtpZ/AtpI family protein n=1 Tax=Roseitranquillus sediminis TaxID=2809051 RepID=UPI001D0C4DD7|nr:AtpZ/AtpI family protein [Roseitranquillus sediminis]